MQYLVSAKGKVASEKYEIYAIEAQCEEAAKKIAEEQFKKENELIGECVYIQNPINRQKRAIYAIALLAVAILISFIPFEHKRSFLWWELESEWLYLAPENLIPVVFGLGVYSLFVVRFKGVENLIKTKSDIILCILTVLLLASFFNLALCGESVRLFFIPIDQSIIYIVILLMIVCSLMKFKSASVMCMCFIALISISNIQEYAEAMGIFGVIYALCSFFGIIFHLSVEPEVLKSLPYIQKTFKKMSKHIKDDFLEAREEIKNLK